MNAKERNQKIEQLKAIKETVDLIKSGYAGIDRNGTIKDRRYNQGLIACRENEMLATPKPLPVKGEFKEGSKEWHNARNRELNSLDDVLEKNIELFNLLKNNTL